MTETTERLHLIIEGRVQGVGFRFYAQEKAKSLGLVGWVKNLPDGHVEIVAEGLKFHLEQLEMLAHHGPPAARVTHVHVRWLPVLGEVTGFRIV